MGLNLFGGGSNRTTTTTGSQTPDWVTNAGKLNYAALLRTVNHPYTPYKAQRVASASPYETAAWAKAGGMLNAPTYFNEAADYIRRAGNAPAQQISMPKELAGEYASRENPYDKDYMNPYVQATLDPAIRNIRETTDLNRNNLNAQALSSGAFGDSRFGIENAMLSRDEAQNIGDITGQTYGAAFTNAQQQRANAIAQLLGLQGQDVSNKMAAQGTNAALMEQMFGRQAAAGGALSGLQQAQTADELDRINAAAGAGQAQRSIDQANKDFAYQQFIEGRDWDTNTLQLLQQFLQGTPYDRKTIQTTQKPDSTWSDILTAVGSYAGS